MEYDYQQLDRLLQNPIESSNAELKAWLNPNLPEHQSKIIKACIALYNEDGGYLLIGFTDEGVPDRSNLPLNVRQEFHIDKIQGLLSKYLSKKIEIRIEFRSKSADIEHPIIIVPSGVTTPIYLKCDIREKDKTLLNANKIFVRSLNSNNTISSAEPKGDDWDKLIKKCLDNKEADIAKFFKRHFTSDQLNALRQFFSLSQSPPSFNSSSHTKTKLLLDDGHISFQNSIQGRNIDLPSQGSWEVAFFPNEVVRIPLDNKLLKTLYTVNPRYIGWPLWVMLFNATNPENKPKYVANGYEALILHDNEIDYWRINENYEFYLYRALEDDTRADIPGKVLDFSIQILRVAEAIGVGLAFSSVLGEKEENLVSFSFRWRGLENRKYGSWTKYKFYNVPDETAYKDEVISYVNVPLSTSKTNIYQYVNIATKPLFEAFGGFEVPIQTIEGLTNNLLNRTL